MVSRGAGDLGGARCMTGAASGPGYYERAGHRYTALRRSDPRIAAALTAALGDAASVVNVGAGAGSYEPPDRAVVAVEPSAVMLAQRRSAAPPVRAVSEALPFPDDSFDAALAVLTLHHWSDWRRGVAELRRVARRAVLLTFDAEAEPHFWLFDYFPGILASDRTRMPPLGELCALLDATATPLPIAHDCTDGLLGAHWRAPERYLDAGVRAATSGFAALAATELADGLRRLAADLDSGAWTARYGRLLRQDEAELGYRVVVGSRR
jgi:SAM-dependent methyltransferase